MGKLRLTKASNWPEISKLGNARSNIQTKVWLQRPPSWTTALYCLRENVFLPSHFCAPMWRILLVWGTHLQCLCHHLIHFVTAHTGLLQQSLYAWDRVDVWVSRESDLDPHGPLALLGCVGQAGGCCQLGGYVGVRPSKAELDVRGWQGKTCFGGNVNVQNIEKSFKYQF